MSNQIDTSSHVGYPVCINADCTVAGTCLHQLAYTKLVEARVPNLRLINPELCSKSGDCKYYRNSNPVTYARGFIGMQNRMYPIQYKNFMLRLIGWFGRTKYFELRRGTIALSPKEQNIVLEVLHLVGVEEDLGFDRYEEDINWYD